MAKLLNKKHIINMNPFKKNSYSKNFETSIDLENKVSKFESKIYFHIQLKQFTDKRIFQNILWVL